MFCHTKYKSKVIIILLGYILYSKVQQNTLGCITKHVTIQNNVQHEIVQYQFSLIKMRFSFTELCHRFW